MKHTLIILILLTASIQTFAQSPRIKLNQITKDSVTGSVLISSTTDSGMVYSRDLFISYGADTVLILGGDTLAKTSGIISSVLSDGVTITGDGTTGTPLSVVDDGHNHVISNVDNLQTTLDGKQAQLNGTGFVKATGTTISYDNSTYLTGNQTITLSGDVTGSGTTAITATVVDDSHNHIISNVDNLQDSLNSRMVNDFSNASGTLPVANGGTGSATQNFVDLTNAQNVGGAKTFTSALTQSGGNVNFDSGTLFVDAGENRVGIGTNLSEFSPFLPKLGIIDTFGGFDSSIKIIKGSASNTSIEYKNILAVEGYSSSTTNIDANITMLMRQLTDVDGNYANFNFFSAIGNNLGGFGMNFIDHSGLISDFYFATANGGAATIRMTIKGDGGVEIPFLLNASTGNTMYYNTTTDEISYSSSSIRFKDEIEDLPIGLNDLMKLKPSRYTYLPDGQKDYGYIAEQVYDIGLTEFVTFNENGQIEGLKDKYFMVLHTKAIQEQQAIIETQATEIEELKSQIQLILSEIEQIKNK